MTATLRGVSAALAGSGPPDRTFAGLALGSRRRIADLTPLTKEAAPVGDAQIVACQLDLAAGTDALVVDKPVLPEHERFFPFQELKAVSTRLVDHPLEPRGRQCAHL